MGKYSNLNTARAFQHRRRLALKDEDLCVWCGREEPWFDEKRGRTLVTCEACTRKKRVWARDLARGRRDHLRKLKICVQCQARAAAVSPENQRETRCAVCIERDEAYKDNRKLVRKATLNESFLMGSEPFDLYEQAAALARAVMAKGNHIEIKAFYGSHRWTDAPKVFGWAVDVLGGVALVFDAHRLDSMTKKPSYKPRRKKPTAKPLPMAPTRHAA